MLPEPIKRLIHEFSRLPGIGPKSAERLTFYLLKQENRQVQEIADALMSLKEGVVYCERCCNMSETTPCAICQNTSREQQQVCIVEEPMDVFVLEQTGVYNGTYHVLHGALSPLDGIGPEQLTISKMLKRLDAEAIEEVIFAMNPTVTGEATSVYLSRLFRSYGVRLTHLAQGLPMGGELEFAGEDTLKKALIGRQDV